jgi:glycerol-3-phosphate dehydrogenase
MPVIAKSHIGMNRKKTLQQLDNFSEDWDIVIIGGGATGLGTAVDAASRGYKTLLLEQDDFTKGTSSRSTKLIHGGVRYLEQGNVSLVLEALKERGLLLKNAPHLVKNLSFIIPSFSYWKTLYFTIGLKLYDLLALKYSFGKSSIVSKQQIIKDLPTIHAHELKNGIQYHDGQFDDSRLGINLAQTCCDWGGYVLNYCKVKGLNKDKNQQISGVQAVDLINGKEYTINAKVIVNATGVFTDQIIQLDQPKAPKQIKPSQGTHIVVDRKFLPSDKAILIPKTDDGRVLFALPWYGKLLAGTTDILIEDSPLEPIPQNQEVQFILSNLNKYLDIKVRQSDIRSVFSGLRPLAIRNSNQNKTKEISRSHTIYISPSGLISITGGKWTTYRKMAQDAINKAIETGKLSKQKCKTADLKIHGHHTLVSDIPEHLKIYGSDAEKILNLSNENPEYSNKIHQDYDYTVAEIIWAVRQEMALTVEDFLARRVRLLFIDAQSAIEASPIVAKYMAIELNHQQQWIEKQLLEFEHLASNYIYKY